jgi:hypothetical protein
VALGGAETVKLVAAPGPTAIEELAAEVASAMPEVRAAVSVIDSAFVYWTELSVTELVPFAIEAVLPVSVPVPDDESDTPVSEVTLAALPNGSCDWTET